MNTDTAENQQSKRKLMNSEIFINLTLLLFLAAAARQDWKTQQLSAALLIGGGTAGLLLRIIFNRWDWGDLLLGIGVGMLLLFVSFASRQAISCGDGLLLAATGSFLGGTGNLVLLLSSLLSAALGSVVLLAAHKKKGKDRIAFAPFVLSGFVLMKGFFG